MIKIKIQCAIKYVTIIAIIIQLSVSCADNTSEQPPNEDGDADISEDELDFDLSDKESDLDMQGNECNNLPPIENPCDSIPQQDSILQLDENVNCPDGMIADSILGCIPQSCTRLSDGTYLDCTKKTSGIIQRCIEGDFPTLPDGSNHTSSVLYVDAHSISDNPDGSRSNPYSTISKAVEIALLNGISYVFVGPGTYSEEIKIIDAEDLTILGMGEHRTLIEPITNTQEYVISARQSSIRVSGFNLSGGRVASLYVGASTGKTEIDNLRISNPDGFGIKLYRAEHETILHNNLIENCKYSGIQTEFTKMEAYENQIFKIGLNQTNSTNLGNSKGIVSIFGNETQIAYNQICKIEDIGISISGGSNKITIHGNRITNAKTSGVFIEETENIVSLNIILNTRQANGRYGRGIVIQDSPDTNIANNILVSNHEAGIYFYGQGSSISNNSVLNTKQSEVLERSIGIYIQNEHTSMKSDNNPNRENVHNNFVAANDDVGISVTDVQPDVKNNLILQNGFSGLIVGYCQDANITDNMISGTKSVKKTVADQTSEIGGYGIALVNSGTKDHVIITGNTISSNYSIGIIQELSHSKIGTINNGNSITKNGIAGIAIGGTSENENTSYLSFVEHNEISNNAGVGLWATGNIEVLLNENNISDNSCDERCFSSNEISVVFGDGLVLHDGAKAGLTANTLNRNERAGVIVDNSAVTFSGNVGELNIIEQNHEYDLVVQGDSTIDKPDALETTILTEALPLPDEWYPLPEELESPYL